MSREHMHACKFAVGSASSSGSAALCLQAASVRMLIDAAAAADEGELLHVSSDVPLEACAPIQYSAEQPR